MWQYATKQLPVQAAIQRRVDAASGLVGDSALAGMGKSATFALVGGLGMYNRRSLAAVLAALAACAATPARAATKKFPDFPPPPADQLKTAGDQNLAVGVYVMADVVQQKTYFDADLSRSGITPIWVSISNLSQDSTFLFDVGELGLTAPHPDHAGFSPGSASVDDSAATALAITDLFVGTLVMGLIAQSKMTDASNSKKELVDRGLYSRTLAPGQSTNGFVYVRRDKAHADIAGHTLSVTAHPVPNSAGSTAIHYSVAL
jgi:hypothetical protein